MRLIMWALAALLGVGPVCAEVLIGQMLIAIDGDTITVLDDDKQKYKIQVSGIDSPEKVQPFGFFTRAICI